eukprot:30497-Pelagococcus_subviridis.AAC.37
MYLRMRGAVNHSACRRVTQLSSHVVGIKLERVRRVRFLLDRGRDRAARVTGASRGCGGLRRRDVFHLLARGRVLQDDEPARLRGFPAHDRDEPAVVVELDVPLLAGGDPRGVRELLLGRLRLFFRGVRVFVVAVFLLLVAAVDVHPVRRVLLFATLRGVRLHFDVAATLRGAFPRLLRRLGLGLRSRGQHRLNDLTLVLLVVRGHRRRVREQRRLAVARDRAVWHFEFCV